MTLTTGCAGCGRELPYDDMVAVRGRGMLCGPCQRTEALQDEQRDSIDAAWRAAEASLPKGWILGGIILGSESGDWYASAGTWGNDIEEAQARADSPPAALRALARQLNEST